MNLNMVQPKNEREDLLLSKTKTYETLFKQTHRKSEETLDIELTKSKKTFHFNPPVEIKEDWMIGLVNLEVHNSLFNITEENNKVELYTDDFESDFSFNELKDKVAKVLGFSDVSTGI